MTLVWLMTFAGNLRKFIIIFVGRNDIRSTACPKIPNDFPIEIVSENYFKDFSLFCTRLSTTLSNCIN